MIGAIIAMFTATNIDDILLLTLFFARRVPTRRVVAGQYLGFTIIIVLSLFGALAALSIPRGWIRLTGLVPLAIGIRQLGTIDRSSEKSLSETSILSIALVTLSNGSDNIGVYVPFFVVAHSSLPFILGAYAVLIAILCLIGKWLGGRSFALRAVHRTGRWLVPTVFICLGAYILVAS